MAQPSIHISMFYVVVLLVVTSVLSISIANQIVELEKINKPVVKTINSPDGDIIDCVLFHDQPAFDLPELQDQKTILELPEWPMGYNSSDDTKTLIESFQLWSHSGEECPEGTIPIIRTNNMISFGQKYLPSDGHEYATAFVSGDQYYGARAYMNVWQPVTEREEFSLAQMWLSAGTYVGKDLNTIEVGWQVFPDKYGGNNPRLFAFWTRDAYQSTGCYNLLCPGFVQVNKRIAFGAAITPISSYNGKQFEITLMVWKDPKNGNWWLSFGSGTLIGYWPSSLFTTLKSHANLMTFGGEIVNRQRNGHTKTQMGSGHFAEEGFRKAALFRSLGFVNSSNKLSPIPLPNLKPSSDHPNCYDIKVLSDNVYGTHFYYGGPGKNPKCP
ncbi:PREDICTED: uncharacterized protein LOC109329427 [Lupinus angustifolius]|uniref:uncharacterized protein LOC109329427 n=1 Tax=Lupinus angustifolius TaxID=3871 RepID=UPI00092E27D8|nr:PREDICTED: uncharacterized protein LOC109329427 [Lupinus angustifolius]